MTAGALVDGGTALHVDGEYVEREINACNVRAFLREAYQNLQVALRTPITSPSAELELDRAEQLFGRIVVRLEQPGAVSNGPEQLSRFRAV